MTVELERRFNDALERWKKHCRDNAHFSFAEKYLDSDAYREIVKMGPEVLPLIQQTYASESEEIGNPRQFWAYAIHEIIGDDFRIDVNADSPVKPVCSEFVAINVRGVKNFTLKWLEENMHKYLKR